MTYFTTLDLQYVSGSPVVAASKKTRTKKKLIHQSIPTSQPSTSSCTAIYGQNTLSEGIYFLAKSNPTPTTQIELGGISPNIAQLVKPFITPNFDP